MSNTSHGNAVPADVTLIAGSDGTSALRLKTDSSGELQVDVLSGTITTVTTVTTVGTVSAITAGNVTLVPLATSGAATTTSHPVTQATKAVVKASAGNVFKFHATNDNAAVRYFQLHNKATAPAGTDVPVLSKKIPAGTATAPGWIEFEFKYGEAFATGIGWAISTTQATFTDSATATEHEVIVEAK